jgi:hypothetical protein
MTVTALTGTAGSGELALVDLLTRVRVTVSNTGDAPVSPHFATSTGATISDYWQVLSGPATLAPHATAVYLLKAPWGGVDTPGVKGRILLRAVSSQPMTLSTQLIGVGPNPSTLPASVRKVLDSGHGFPRSSDDGLVPHTGVEGITGR